jgi:hypothetical protein
VLLSNGNWSAPAYGGNYLKTNGQLELNFEELKPASHVSILGTILNLFDVFVAVFFSVKFLEFCGMTDNC